MAMADTTPSKVYDIAEKLGYEGARTQSSAKAVYACADALGFVGPHARRITDALSDLKTVVGGGGGGVDLGALQASPSLVTRAPVVGNEPHYDDYVFSRYSVGDSVAIDDIASGGPGYVAAGLTCTVLVDTSAGFQADGYVCTLQEGEQDFVYATVAQWGGTITVGQDDDGVTPISLIMPALQDGEMLFVHLHT